MAISVYFDTTQIPDDSVSQLTLQHRLFSDSFYLGATSCASVSLWVEKSAVTTQPTKVYIKDGTTTLYTLNVDSIDDSDDFVYKYSLLDDMVKLNFYYDASPLIEAEGGSATLAQILADMCTKAGITLYPTTFDYSTAKISWYDNTLQAREYLSYIAELNGGYAYIDGDGSLCIKPFSNTSAASYNLNEIGDYEIGEHTTYSGVKLELGSATYTAGDSTGSVLSLNPYNVYFDDSIGIQAEVDHIYSLINGFNYYSFKTAALPTYTWVEPGRLVTFDTYPAVYELDYSYFGDIYGGLDSVLDTPEQTATEASSPYSKIKGLKIEVNRQEGYIRQTASEVTQQGESLLKTASEVEANTANLKSMDDYVYGTGSGSFTQSILTQTASQFTQQFTQTGIEDEVGALKTKTTNIKSNAGGITITVDNSNYSSNMNNTGFTVLNGSNPVMTANNEGVSAEAFLIDKDWVIDSTNGGNILAFYRRF